MSALSAVFLIFSFQFRSAFLPCRLASPHSGVRGLPNIGHRTLPTIWVGLCVESTAQGNDFELILTVKMETRHPIEGSLVENFRRSVIIA